MTAVVRPAPALAATVVRRVTPVVPAPALGRRIDGTVVPAVEVRRDPGRLITRAARPSLSRAPETSPERRQWMSLRRTHVGMRTNAHTATIPNQMTALIALPT
jgi:hypothetical protein